MGPLKCGLIESGLNIQGPKYTKLNFETELCGFELAWNQIMWPWIGLEPNYVALDWIGTELCGLALAWNQIMWSRWSQKKQW